MCRQRRNLALFGDVCSLFNFPVLLPSFSIPRIGVPKVTVLTVLKAEIPARVRVKAIEGHALFLHFDCFDERSKVARRAKENSCRFDAPYLRKRYLVTPGTAVVGAPNYRSVVADTTIYAGPQRGNW